MTRPRHHRARPPEAPDPSGPELDRPAQWKEDDGGVGRGWLAPCGALSDRMRRFADGVLAGRPASRAYAEAGYRARNAGAAEASASRLLRDAKVAAYLAERRAGAARQAETGLAWVLRQLRAVAEDRDAPHGAKVSALRVMAELHTGGHAPVALGVAPPADLADAGQVRAFTTVVVAAVAAGWVPVAHGQGLLALINNAHAVLMNVEEAAPEPPSDPTPAPARPPVRIAWLEGGAAPPKPAGGGG